jgi:hypothetical protein
VIKDKKIKLSSFSDSGAYPSSSSIESSERFVIV